MECLCYLVLLVGAMLDITAANHGEYCKWDLFEPDCPRGEVIVMRSASYGRMRTGRCAPEDLGFIGCQADVLHVADRKCSGLRSCVIKLPDYDLGKTKPCKAGLEAYLEADYECMGVNTADLTQCNGAHQVYVWPRPANLLIDLAQDLDECPHPRRTVTFKAFPGQTVKLSMIDLYWEQGPDGAQCREYARIVEAFTREEVPICGGSKRQHTIYSSMGNVINIHANLKGNKVGERFILTYQAEGCPDLRPPKNVWVKRDGNYARYGCGEPGNGPVTNLKCEFNRWNGTVGNCTGQPLGESVPLFEGSEGDDDGFKIFGASIPFEILLVAVAGVAVIVIALVVCCACLCCKRCRQKRGRNRKSGVMYNNVCTDDQLKRKSDAYWYNSNTLEFHRGYKQDNNTLGAHSMGINTMGNSVPRDLRQWTLDRSSVTSAIYTNIPSARNSRLIDKPLPPSPPPDYEDGETDSHSYQGLGSMGRPECVPASPALLQEPTHESFEAVHRRSLLLRRKERTASDSSNSNGGGKENDVTNTNTASTTADDPSNDVDDIPCEEPLVPLPIKKKKLVDTQRRSSDSSNSSSDTVIHTGYTKLDKDAMTSQTAQSSSG